MIAVFYIVFDCERTHTVRTRSHRARAVDIRLPIFIKRAKFVFVQVHDKRLAFHDVFVEYQIIHIKPPRVRTFFRERKRNVDFFALA